MKQKITAIDTIGSVVATDYNTTTVFYRYHIDFCCGGDKQIGEVCREKKIDEAVLLNEVNGLLNSEEVVGDPSGLKPDQLIQHILEKHHRYVQRHIPVILEFLEKLCRVHGENHPELFEIKQVFGEGAEHLLMHMKKEENVLFPMIKNMVHEQNEGRHPAALPYSTFMPIRMMRHEHETEGNRFAHLAELTNSYTPPADACSTYKAAFALMHEFEKDLHRHIHLENNVLFPAALEMEQHEL